MKRTLIVLFVILALAGGIAFAQDLKIEYQYDITGTSRTNYFTFTGPIRYMAVDKDHYDGRTGASVHGSTEKFQPYRYDVKGRTAIPGGLRGLFLFAVAESDQPKIDNLQVDKASNGVITIQYAHRGTAYRITTDRNGVISMPNAKLEERTIGFIQSAGPQVISRDFSRNGQASTIDYGKVWSSSVAGGKPVQAGSDRKTGDIKSVSADSDSMFYWSGDLKVTFVGNTLSITGGLNAIER
jgi:hypothetical protein